MEFKKLDLETLSEFWNYCKEKFDKWTTEEKDKHSIAMECYTNFLSEHLEQLENIKADIIREKQEKYLD